jgi:hypothetical protein
MRARQSLKNATRPSQTISWQHTNPAPNKPYEVCSLKIWTRWLFLILFGLGACSAPLPSPSPVPSPQPLRVQIDPAFEPLRPLLVSCVPPGLALYFARSGQPADLKLTWGQPADPGGQVFVLGSEELVLVVHPTNPLTSFSHSFLQQVYAGKFNNWDPLGGAHVPLNAWAYPGGDPWENFVEDSLLKPAELSSLIHISPGPGELRAEVASDPGGLGFLPRRWLDKSVRELPIADVTPTSLTRPLLAATANQPQGGEKDFLLCLQEGLKTQ